MRGSERNRALAADAVLLLVAAIWGGGFVAGKLALEGLPPVAILVYRFCGSALILGVVFAKRIARADRYMIKCGCLLGALQFLGLMVQMVALQYTTSAKQSFLAATYVCFTPLTAWLLTKVKPTARDGAAALAAIVGVGFISLNSALEVQAGDPMTLGFSLIFSVQIVLTGKYARERDPLVLAFFQFCAAGVLAAAAAVVTGADMVCSGASAASGLAYLVFINTALALCLQNTAQRYTKASHTALILSLESVFGFLFSMLIYREAATARIILGGALVLAGILISKLPARKSASAESLPR